jgi:hypothetical protein
MTLSFNCSRKLLIDDGNPYLYPNSDRRRNFNFYDRNDDICSSGRPRRTVGHHDSKIQSTDTIFFGCVYREKSGHMLRYIGIR